VVGNKILASLTTTRHAVHPRLRGTSEIIKWRALFCQYTARLKLSHGGYKHGGNSKPWSPSMVEFINAVKELVVEVGRLGPTGIALLALVVALAAIRFREKK